MKVFTSNEPKAAAINALKAALFVADEVPILFLVSGGSSLGLLVKEILPEKCVNLAVSVLDEHYVADATERNFFKLKNLPFFSRLEECHAELFDPYEGDVEPAGKRLNAFLKSWFVRHPDGRLVCTVGIGADGHTMGIMPFLDEEKYFTALFNSPETLAVGYKTSYGAFPERLTSTFSLISKASDVVVYAAGAEKKVILQKLFQRDEPVHEFPAQFLKTLPQATLFTDIKV